MIELFFIDQCPARLCRALARVPGTVRSCRPPGAGFERAISAWAWGEQRRPRRPAGRCYKEYYWQFYGDLYWNFWCILPNHWR